MESLYVKIEDGNNKISSGHCKAVLKELHAEMSEQADRHLLTNPEDEDIYSFQSTEFKVRCFADCKLLTLWLKWLAKTLLCSAFSITTKAISLS